MKRTVLPTLILAIAMVSLTTGCKRDTDTAASTTPTSSAPAAASFPATAASDTPGGASQ
ncbi:hypothetical protein P9250_15595 [Caballeronia sp. LP006]|uniref:hypothetical protein n=1 Tax=unclassified Caballeronia TaxID=2646786 RepID=UPI0020283F85|nr:MULTISPECIES: hypothetical protein [unclassified Caballeronia]MDR5829311.1 hypothetical protein [Caballeronia sp. LP006]